MSQRFLKKREKENKENKGREKRENSAQIFVYRAWSQYASLLPNKFWKHFKSILFLGGGEGGSRHIPFSFTKKKYIDFYSFGIIWTIWSCFLKWKCKSKSQTNFESGFTLELGSHWNWIFDDSESHNKTLTKVTIKVARSINSPVLCRTGLQTIALCNNKRQFWCHKMAADSRALLWLPLLWQISKPVYGLWGTKAVEGVGEGWNKARRGKNRVGRWQNVWF